MTSRREKIEAVLVDEDGPSLSAGEAVMDHEVNANVSTQGLSSPMQGSGRKAESKATCRGLSSPRSRWLIAGASWNGQIENLPLQAE